MFDGAARYRLEPVEPIGEETLHVIHYYRGVAGEYKRFGAAYVYPEDTVADGKRLKEVRQRLDMDLGTAARVLGLKVLLLSCTERGEMRGHVDAMIGALVRASVKITVVSDPSTDDDECMRRLERHRGGRGPDEE